MPHRVQLRRTKGWKKPKDAVVVSRPSQWGNPFPIDGDWIVWTAVGLGYTGNPAGRRAAAIALHRAWLTSEPLVLGPHASSTDGGSLVFADGTERTLNEHCLGIARFVSLLFPAPELPARPPLDELRGHDLACWCPLDQPCHADVLIEVANVQREARMIYLNGSRRSFRCDCGCNVFVSGATGETYECNACGVLYESVAG